MPAALRPLGADRADSVRAAARVPRAAAQRVPPRVRCALVTLQTPGMEHEACADALPARDGAIWCRAAAKFAQKLRTHTHPRAHAHDLSDTGRGKLSTAPACTTEPGARARGACVRVPGHPERGPQRTAAWTVVRRGASACVCARARARADTGFPDLWCVWHEAGRRTALLGVGRGRVSSRQSFQGSAASGASRHTKRAPARVLYIHV